MPTQDDVRQIVLSLPATTEDARGFRFFVDGKQFVWSWMERVDPKRARVANPDVIAVSVRDEDEKQALIALDDAVFFTEPHYDGYNAILVRLAAIDLALLAEVLTSGWQCRASRSTLSRGSNDRPRG